MHCDAQRVSAAGLAGRMDPAGDGPGEAVGGGRAEPGKMGLAARAQGARGCRQGEDDITVERCVNRADGAGETVLGHDGETLGLGRGQRNVGRDHSDRGVFARAGLHLGGPPVLGRRTPVGGWTTPPELGPDLVRPGPVDIVITRQGDRAETVDADQRGNASALAGQGQAGGAGATGMKTGTGPMTGAERTQLDCVRDSGQRHLAQRPIGRFLAPALVAAIGEIT